MQRTVDYLLNELVGGAESLGSVHHFVWDRTRAIRNDFSIQQITKPADAEIAIECFERIARFHILSLHQLAVPDGEKPYDQYDWYQEREQLDRTFLSLMQYYDDAKHSQGRIVCRNESEFRAYMVVFQIHNRTPDLEERVNNWDPRVKSSGRVKKALDIYAAACNVLDPQGPFKPGIPHPVAREDWDRFFALVRSRQTSYLMACVAEIYFNLTRTAILNAVWQAFKPQGSKLELPNFTLELLTNIMGFDEADQTQDFCQRHSFAFKENVQGELFLDLNSVRGRSLPAPSPALSRQTFSDSIVEIKRAGRTLPAVINGLSVTDSQRDGLIEELAEESRMEEDDDDSIFVPLDTARTPSSFDTLGPSLFDPAPASRVTVTPSPFAIPIEKPSGFGQPSAANVPATNGPQAASVFGQPSDTQTPSMFAQPSMQPSSIFAQPFNTQAPSISTQPSTTINNSPFAVKSTQNSFSIFGQPSAANTHTTIEAKPLANPFGNFPQTSAPKLISPTITTATVTEGVTATNDGTAPISQSGQKPASSVFATTTATPKSNLTSFSFASKPTDSSPVGQSKNAPIASSPTTQSPTTKFPSFNSVLSQQPLPQTPIEADEPSNDLFEGPSPAGDPVPDQQGQNQPVAESSTTSAFNFPTPSVSFKPPTSPQARKPSFSFSSQPKKPSPLSQSFSANDNNGNPSQPSHVISFQQPLPEVKQMPQSKGASSAEVPPAAPSNTVAPQAPQLSSPKPQPQPQPKIDILEKLAHEVIVDYNTGLIRQFVEYHARTTVMDIWNQLQLEKFQELADSFRKETLRYRYGRMWRDICWRRRLVRQGREKRRKAKRTQETRELRKRLAAETNAVDEFLKSTQTKNLGRSISKTHVQPIVKSPPAITRASADETSTSLTLTVATKRSASSNGSDSISLSQSKSHKRLKSFDHVDGVGRIIKSQARASRDSTPASRASYLTFNVQSTRADSTLPVPSIRSNYFRLKALGINPSGNASSSLAKKRTRDQSEESDKETAPPAKKSRTPPRTDSNVLELQQSSVSPAYSQSSVEVGVLRNNKPLSAAQQEDEALFARARAARQAMSDTAAWYRSEVHNDEKQHTQELAAPVETLSMQRARQEARFRASRLTSATGGAPQDVPAYRLRESRFVPRERYGQAIERARGAIEARSNPPQTTLDPKPSDVQGHTSRTTGGEAVHVRPRLQEHSTGYPKALDRSSKQQSHSTSSQPTNSSQFFVRSTTDNIPAPLDGAQSTQQSHALYSLQSAPTAEPSTFTTHQEQFETLQAGSPTVQQKMEGLDGTNPFAVLNGYHDNESWSDDPSVFDSSALDPSLSLIVGDEDARASISVNPATDQTHIDDGNGAFETDLLAVPYNEQYAEDELASTCSVRSNVDESEVIMEEDGLDEDEGEYYSEEEGEDLADDVEGEDFDESEDLDESEGFDESEEEEYDEDGVHYPVLPGGMQNGDSVIKAGTGTAEDAFELSD